MKRTKFTPLSELTKSSRIKRVSMVAVDMLVIIVTLALMTAYLLDGDPKNRLMACIGTVACIILPYAVEYIRGLRYSPLQHLLFSIYIFVTMFLGSVLNLHTEFAPMDEIAHFLFGYFSSIMMLYIMITMPSYLSTKPLTMTFIIMMASLGTAVIWEGLEFVVDLVAGQSSLGYPPQEVLDYIVANNITGLQASWLKLSYVGVTDTITDMCLHLGGSIVFAIQYYLHRKLNISLVIGSLIKERQASLVNSQETTKSNDKNGEKNALSESDQ